MFVTVGISCGTGLEGMPRACSELPSSPPKRPASITSDRVKKTPNQLTLSPPQQPDRDEHELGGEVGDHRGDDAMAHRGAALLEPRCTAGAEDETEHRAEEEQRVQAAVVGVDERGDERQRHRQDQADTDAGPDRFWVESTHGQGVAPERGREPELAGVHDAVRVERRLEGDQDPMGRTERLGHEPPAIDPDAVMMRQVAAGGEHRPLPGVPQCDVGRLDVVGWRGGGEREVQARAVGVAVRQVAGRRAGVGTAIIAARTSSNSASSADHGAAISIVSTTKPLRVRPWSAEVSLRWSSHASTRSTSAGAHRQRAAPVDDRHRGVDEVGVPSSSTSRMHSVPSPP
jgi:hypothetical protein